jgi:hypothetical protein
VLYSLNANAPRPVPASHSLTDQNIAIISRLVDHHGSHCCGDSALARAASATDTLPFDTGGDMLPCAVLEICSAKAQGAGPRAVGYSIRC